MENVTEDYDAFYDILEKQAVEELDHVDNSENVHDEDIIDDDYYPAVRSDYFSISDLILVCQFLHNDFLECTYS